MSEHKLKPCPFCGSPAKLEERGDHHGTYFNLGCSSKECPAHDMFYTWTSEEGSVEDAVALWDRRDDAAVKALVGLLKEAHECVCDLLCPSIGKAGVPIKHGELCNRIREAMRKVEGL